MKQFSKMTVDDLQSSFIRGKRVFMRVDFNVPMEEGEVGDDTRIRSTLPTIEKLRSSGARLVLASHLGRPKGAVDPQYSLRPVAKKLGQLLGTEIHFSSEIIGPSALEASKKLPDGGVMLLENVRFDPGETSNDPAFAQELSRLGDFFVNDAFGTCHRAHATTVGVPSLLKPAVAGLLVKKELEYLRKLLATPEHPFIAILGGKKASDKIGVFKNLLGKIDAVIVGGAMASTFFRAKGLGVGTTFVQEELTPVASEIIDDYREKGIPILIPTDCVVSKSTQVASDVKEVANNSIPPQSCYVDIGSDTRKRYAKKISTARTIVWNGPMGIFEVDEFAGGTQEVARAVAQAAGSGAVVVVGGGDSVRAVIEAGYADRVSHLSTGGGAFLEVLEGKDLPGVEALSVREEGGK
ncbi:MAG: phosphoglycerate kinase [Candidatus Glassbacteria bacterium]